MSSYQELYELAERLSAAASVGDDERFSKPVEDLRSVAERVGRASTGSWLGYHASVYYDGLNPPPPGAHFSQEWGLTASWPIEGSVGDWVEVERQAVIDAIHARAGHPDLHFARNAAKDVETIFAAAKSEILSIIHTELARRSDSFLEKLKDEVEKLELATASDVREYFRPKGHVMTRDMTAMGQGTRVPPHIIPLSEAMAFQHSIGVCRKGADAARKAASHVERQKRQATRAERVGTNVFIGHGRSGAWRELKDFVADRLKLPWDEFNRVPVAGVTNIARLSEMLDAAAIAFLVMTAEDETASGEHQARMNVIHEAGLFQGRLGFSKAIVLLEEGCAEFSNIQGLGQIRFPKGRVAAVFEQVRDVVEREGLLDEAAV